MICQIAAALLSVSVADVEVERFDGGEFTNPFFSYEFEFGPCCWAIQSRLDDPGNPALRLVPNFAQITFDLADAEIVESASVTIIDYEGGIAMQPSSPAIFRGASGDFVFRNAAQLGVATVVSATQDDLGQLTGEPIGPIVQIDLQAANEYQPAGAWFDDITVNIAGGCIADFNGDGELSILDFVAFQAAFVGGDDAADCDGDGALSVLDFVCFQQAFVAGCP